MYDSLLSEYAALGFEYGYAHGNTDALVLWEAQFGDFINGAQIIIDQFLVAAEDKWDQNNGLVLLLPHGYEGQGPEHSSARIERFLILAAEDNLQLCNATTAAQYFHLLRRQVHSERHTPLVVFTPKQGLRMKQTRSAIDDLTTGSFEEVIDDADRRAIRPRSAGSSSAPARSRGTRSPNAIGAAHRSRSCDSSSCTPCRPSRCWRSSAATRHAKELIWLQEEPENMGAWHFIEHHTWRVKEQGYDLHHVSRVASGSPATGSKTVHDQELADLMDEVFAGL